MPLAYLGLGSNLGDRQGELDRAIACLDHHPDIKLLKVAKYLETEPVGYAAQGLFLNTVVSIETSLAPKDLLAYTQSLEEQAHRVRIVRFGPRTLDVDILLYDDLVQETEELTIPHPRLRERLFVLVPLAEIAPKLRLPPDAMPITAARDSLQKGGRGCS